MKAARFALIPLILTVVSAHASDYRIHYNVARQGTRATFVDASTVSSTNGEKTEETYLIKTADGQQLVVEIDKNFPAHKITTSYSVNGGKAVKITIELPGKATTHAGVIAELRDAQARDLDAAVAVEGKSVFKTSDHQLRDDKTGNIRKQSRVAAGEDVAAAFAAVRQIFGFPAFGGVCSTLPYLTGSSCAGSPNYMIAMMPPDCDFDASFGMPCDTNHLAKATARRHNGTTGPY